MLFESTSREEAFERDFDFSELATIRFSFILLPWLSSRIADRLLAF
jgi:hypothetical protein